MLQWSKRRNVSQLFTEALLSWKEGGGWASWERRGRVGEKKTRRRWICLILPAQWGSASLQHTWESVWGRRIIFLTCEWVGVCLWRLGAKMKTLKRVKHAQRLILMLYPEPLSVSLWEVCVSHQHFEEAAQSQKPASVCDEDHRRWRVKKATSGGACFLSFLPLLKHFQRTLWRSWTHTSAQLYLNPWEAQFAGTSTRPRVAAWQIVKQNIFSENKETGGKKGKMGLWFWGWTEISWICHWTGTERCSTDTNIKQQL